MNYKKILFATDFSATSQAALSYASSLARDSGALLVIVHVEEVPLPMGTEPVYFSPAVYPNPEISRLLDAVVPTDPSVRYEHKLASGAAADEIVRLADEEDADLIVIGTHGRTGITRVLVGSVAESVMRRASCPVLTIKASSPATASTE